MKICSSLLVILIFVSCKVEGSKKFISKKDSVCVYVTKAENFRGRLSINNESYNIYSYLSLINKVDSMHWVVKERPSSFYLKRTTSALNISLNDVRPPYKLIKGKDSEQIFVIKYKDTLRFLYYD